MNGTTALTTRQTILVAATGLGPEFHETDLAVACWKRDPLRFGLKPYPRRYPDPNVVRSELMGRTCQRLRVSGYVESVRPRVYRLTPKGVEAAERAKAHGRAPLNPGGYAAGQSRTQDRNRLTHMARSVAYRRWREGNVGYISSADALAFWRVAPGSRPCEARRRVAATDRTLGRAAEAIGDPTSGPAVDAALVARLRACHEWLIQEFGGLLRARPRGRAFRRIG